MIGLYISINAWREILARIYEDIPCQDNVSPEWLVNPATRRRLKLDKYYPDIGIAIRFVGITAKGQGRQSDWEAQETEQRDETREELCRANGVQLVLVDPDDGDPLKPLDALIRAQARASGQLTGSARSAADKQRWMPKLGAARQRAEELRARIAKAPEQALATLAEAWRDREAGIAAALAAPPAAFKPVRSSLKLSEGQRVRHERYGDGVVTALSGVDEQRKVVILFDGGAEKTFLLSLVQDKLQLLR